jgi:arsenate reductase (thioredoxin)
VTTRQRTLRPRPGVDAAFDQAAGRLAALADPVRLRLLGLLARGDCPVGMLAAALGLSQPLVSFHLKVLREAGIVTAERAGLFTYHRLEPTAVNGLFDEVTGLLALAQPAPSHREDAMGTILFADRRNAGASQMAAALFDATAPAGLRAASAGTHPAGRVDQLAVRAMAEAGIDLASNQPTRLTRELAAGAELLVMLDGVDDPPSPDIPSQRWPVPDRAAATIEQARQVRDELRERVITLLAELDDPGPELDLSAGERAAVHRSLARLAGPYTRLLGAQRVERIVREEVLRLRGVRTRRFLDLLTERHARERLRALAQAEGRLPKAVPEVLFVCVANSARSQLAAALAEQAGGGRIHAWSAGSQPGAAIQPEVAAVLAEVGIDVAACAPKPWTTELVRAADVVVTMGCGDACPYVPGVRYLEWDVPDPAGKSLADVRALREQLRGRVEELIAQLTSPARGTSRAPSEDGP